MKTGNVVIVLIGFALLANLSFGIPITTVDTVCNPTQDTPVAAGCTWYNFYESITTGAPFGTGSSFGGYYSEAGADPWTIADTTDFFTLRVVDGGHQGDTFNVYDNGILLGGTSSTPIDTGHTCANDPTDSMSGVSPGSDPASCWNDNLFSQGTYLLTPNPSGHSIDILWNQKVPGDDSSLQWFEVNTAVASTNAGTVPEPGTGILAGLGLLAFSCLRRRIRNPRS